ncbi:MAG: DUF2304 domain-containing protein [Clostridia bacterium]|nr:DUF2304 domain-containing protein [Clostridia bacterium]
MKLPLSLRLFLIASILVFLFVIVRYLTKKKLNLRYTLVWLATVVVLLILLIFPVIVKKVASLIGISTPVNAVFLFAGMFILLIVLTLTAIVSHMNSRIYKLTQMQAILEKRVRELEADTLAKEEKTEE